MEAIDVKGEEGAWRLLEQLQRSDFEDSTKLPVIKQWDDFHFKFWIQGRSLVLTAPVMEAMLDYQTSVNRAFMLVIESTTQLRGLSEEERQSFELLFTVRRGSSDLSVDAQETINNFMANAIGKVTGKQLTIIVLAFGLLYAGNSSWKVYLEQQKEIAKAETSQKQIKDILEAHKFASEVDLKRMQLLRDALQAAGAGHALLEASEEGKKSVVKAAAKVQDTEVAGARLPPDVAKRMARNARTSPVVTTNTAQFEVVRVDTDVPDGFRVRLKNVETGELVFASVRDRLVSEDDRKLIQRGEWEKKPIVARVSETRRRGELVSAKVEEVLDVVESTEIASK
jgi:hypothetical protein